MPGPRSLSVSTSSRFGFTSNVGRSRYVPFHSSRSAARPPFAICQLASFHAAPSFTQTSVFQPS